MKIITTSDWHIGNLFHGNDRLPEHRHFMRWLLERLKEHRPDALLVAGDVFDNGNPSAAAQAAYYEFLAEATEAVPEMQVVITAGNHDSAHRLEAPRALLSRHRVEIRGAVRRSWVPSDEGGGEWAIDFDDLLIPIDGTEGEGIVVAAVPYLRSDVVRNQEYSAGVNDILRRLVERAREAYPGRPVVMMAHLYAVGADIAPRDASEKIVIGGQEEVNMEGWADHPDYLACGHIHKRQHIRNTDWARYMGSVLPMSFAETDYRHGVDLVEFREGKKPRVEFLEYIPQHRLREIPEGDEVLTPRRLLRRLENELSDRGADGKLDEEFEYVVVKVTLDNVNNDDIRQIEALFEQKNAVLCGIRKIMPALDLTSISEGRAFTSIDDILQRDPLETIRETFAVHHGRELSPEQEALLRELGM